jgi:hypothetical protein
MADDSPKACDDIPHRVKRIREKEAEMMMRREELDVLKKKFIEEHLKLGRDRTSLEEEIRVLEETVAECNRKTAADGSVCFELPPDIKNLRGKEDKQKPAGNHIEKGPTVKVVENNGKTCRPGSNGPYVLVQERKQIRTVLHSILEALNEKGTVKVGDAAKDFGLGKDELLVWAKVMENRGMLDLSYTFRGEALLKKPKAPSN